MSMFARQNAARAFEPTPQQAAIFAHVDTMPPGSSMGIIARAGSGKTTTLVHAIPHTFRKGEDSRILLAAFNADNAKELDARTPSYVEARTFHSLANKLIGGGQQPEVGKKWRIAKAMLPNFHTRWPAVQLAGLAMGIGVDLEGGIPDVLSTWTEMIVEYGIRHKKAVSPETVARAAQTLFRACLKDPALDFDDMLYRLAKDGPGPGYRPYSWIFVDEAQDTNITQMLCLDKLRGPTTRIVFVGDPKQAIYGWRGAGVDAFDLLADRYNAKLFGLTVSMRCPKAVIRNAQTIVPDIVARDNAPEGEVRSVDLGEWSIHDVKPGDVVLCRNNAPLLEVALEAMRADRKVFVAGRDLATRVRSIFDELFSKSKIDPNRGDSAIEDALAEARKEFSDRPFTYAIIKDELTSARCVWEILRHKHPARWANYDEFDTQCSALLASVFFDPQKESRDGVVLSSIHRCVSPDTLVGYAGGLRRIENIPPDGEIETVAGLRGYHSRVEYPERRMFRVTTKSGYSLDITDDHRMVVWDGAWVEQEAKDLSVGRFLRLKLGFGADAGHVSDIVLPAMPTQDPRATPISVPGKMSVELAEFLGLMVADGTVFDRGIRLVKRDADTVDRFAGLVSSLFGLRTTVEFGRHGKAYAGTVSSRDLSRWLRRFDGLAPHHKGVPAEVLASGPAVWRRFLAGVFEDGTVCVQGGVIDHVALSAKPERLARDVQIMLLGLGIHSVRKYYTNHWRVSIYGDGLDGFRAQVGFVSQRKNQLLLIERRPTRGTRVPVRREDVDDLPDTLRKNARFRGHVTRAVADEMLGWSWIRDYWFDTIESIEPLPDGPAVCVTVPDTGRFLQNGFDGCNSKGKEWTNVYYYRPELVPSKSAAGLGGWHLEQEYNLDYVARTRAKATLTFVRGVAGGDE